MKAKFIGDPNDDFSGPKVLRLAHGPTAKPVIVHFPKDQFVGLPQELEEAVSGNNHFEVEEGDAPAYEGPLEPTRAARALDGDESGKMGGSFTKAQTISKLQALQAEHPEVTFDPKASLAVLRGVLEEAEFEYGDD